MGVWTCSDWLPQAETAPGRRKLIGPIVQDGFFGLQATLGWQLYRENQVNHNNSPN